MISSQKAEGALETVTKSAVMNTLVTPGRASRAAAAGWSAGRPATKLSGVSKCPPTVNLRALGLGVGSPWIAMSLPLDARRW